MLRKLTVAAALLLALAGAATLYVHYRVYPLWGKDVLVVEAESPLSADSLQVWFGQTTFNKPIDSVDLTALRLVYSGGKPADTLLTDYGENDFYVLYRSAYRTRFRHIKLHHKRAHTYHIRLYSHNGTPALHVTVSGAYPCEYTLPMEAAR